MSTTGTILKESINVYEITEQVSLLFSNSCHVEISNDTSTTLLTTSKKNNNNHVDNNNNKNIDDDDDLKLLSFIDDKRNELIKSWNQLEKSMMKQQQEHHHIILNNEHDNDDAVHRGNNDFVGNLRNNVDVSEIIMFDDMNIDNNFMNKDDGSNEEVNQQQHSILFLEMITDSFANELEDLQQQQQQLPLQKQQQNDAIDVLLLVDCLQSGMDLLLSSKTDVKHSDDFVWIKQENHINDDNNSIIEQQQENNKSFNVNKNNNMSAHEKRRQKLGYIV